MNVLIANSNGRNIIFKFQCVFCSKIMDCYNYCYTVSTNLLRETHTTEQMQIDLRFGFMSFQNKLLNKVVLLLNKCSLK